VLAAPAGPSLTIANRVTMPMFKIGRPVQDDRWRAGLLILNTILTELSYLPIVV
jgi:hypothetical protein